MGLKYCDPSIIGRLYFELRQDIVPLACINFLQLVLGVGDYKYKGTTLHRVAMNSLIQGGDLQGTDGEFSRSALPSMKGINSDNFFHDENFILRHTGPGVISYCNRGPNTNGSTFQIMLARNEEMDEKYVVFGCLVNSESFECLDKINLYGSKGGQTKAKLFISDADQVFPRNG